MALTDGKGNELGEVCEHCVFKDADDLNSTVRCAHKAVREEMDSVKSLEVLMQRIEREGVKPLSVGEFVQSIRREVLGMHNSQPAGIGAVSECRPFLKLSARNLRLDRIYPV